MLRLRPYKPGDAVTVVGWIGDENAFRMWAADRYERYPITAEDMNRYYDGFADADWFYPMTAWDESGIAAHMILRFTDPEKQNLRFGFIIVDSAKRGKGYGKELVSLALKYAFEILKVKKVTLGVAEGNLPALRCYEALGFRVDPEEKEVCFASGKQWMFQGMEISYEEYAAR